MGIDEDVDRIQSEINARECLCNDLSYMKKEIEEKKMFDIRYIIALEKAIELITDGK